MPMISIELADQNTFAPLKNDLLDRLSNKAATLAKPEKTVPVTAKQTSKRLS